jgi:hypothetical protein
VFLTSFLLARSMVSTPSMTGIISLTPRAWPALREKLRTRRSSAPTS